MENTDIAASLSPGQFAKPSSASARDRSLAARDNTFGTVGRLASADWNRGQDIAVALNAMGKQEPTQSVHPQ